MAKKNTELLKLKEDKAQTEQDIGRTQEQLIMLRGVLLYLHQKIETLEKGGV